MSFLTESWLQEVVGDNNLPALPPSITKLLLPVIEVEVKRIIQQSHKFQRRSKSRKLTVNDINLALYMNRAEEVYGLSSGSLLLKSHSAIELTRGDNETQNNTSSASASASITIEASKIDLVELARQPLPKFPIAPQIALHWLAIGGVQPKIPENPNVIVKEPDSQPSNLPREMQFLYARTTNSIIAQDKNTLPSVMHAFQHDSGLQELLPFFSRFIFHQIKSNTRSSSSYSINLLHSLIEATKCLLLNPTLHMEFHLHQLIPAVLTCVVGAHLSSLPNEDHWSLRDFAAETAYLIVKKFRDSMPDLQPRVCKTYIDALAADKPLQSVYGGIVGLGVMGHAVTQALLIPTMPGLTSRLKETAYSSSMLCDGGSPMAMEEEAQGPGSTSAAVDLKTSLSSVSSLAVASIPASLGHGSADFEFSSGDRVNKRLKAGAGDADTDSNKSRIEKLSNERIQR